MDILELIKNKDPKYKRGEVLEELYWSPLGEISNEDLKNTIGPYLMETTNAEDYIGVQKLYSNPEGAHIDFFEDIIMSLYKKDPLTFIRAVNENPDEGMNVLYIFRNKGVFLNPEASKEELLNITSDRQMEEMINSFFRYYDNICSTWQ